MRTHLVISSLLVTLIVLPIGALQASGSHDGNHSQSEKKGGHSHKTPHWAKTLNKEQKKIVDEQHHALDNILEPLKKDEKRVHKELNELTTKNNVELSEINRKIDQLMTIKNKILRHRHAHLVEMRIILNDEQRMSYDKAVIERSKIK